MRNHWINLRLFAKTINENHHLEYEISSNGMKFLFEEYTKWDNSGEFKRVQEWYQNLLKINRSGKLSRNLRKVLTA